ncbi:MAG: tryptophan--tRNA ligase [Dysgonamonadaceae bacterium]|jgi:tryptophanyl-tRNA synthetase|nr:tryptophan--tRNA ligase [Dysgonamonadaceae bacterium]
MKTVLSGIRPTGNLHLGNYFGAMVNFLKMQEIHRCFFFIADWHSLTTHPDPKMLHVNVTGVLSEYLACGLDPQKATLYVQSEVPEIAELYLLLNMHAYLGELEKTVSFKEKARQNPQNINAGLLTYPVLMATDILIHNADFVPVGKDQEQHLEMTRNFAARFNYKYGVEYFKMPTAYIYGEKDLIKIPGLDGSRKMGKSDGNCIYLIDEPKIVEKKIKSALTDNGPTGENTPKPECIENLFTILRAVSEPEVVKHYETLWDSGEQRWYGSLKKQLAEDVIKLTTPIRERINNIKNDTKYLAEIVESGTVKARTNASKTLKDVREIMGFKSFS